MREPVFVSPDGSLVPYSAAPLHALRFRAGFHGDPCPEKGPHPDEYPDWDFRRRYAAILLAERGQ